METKEKTIKLLNENIMSLQKQIEAEEKAIKLLNENSMSLQKQIEAIEKQIIILINIQQRQISR